MMLTLALFPLAAQAQGFDLDTGNAPIEIVIPTAAPRILTRVGAMDATFVLRFTTIITAGWFDAIAPYDDAADAVHMDLGRRPEEERTDRNRNIAILYASHKTLNSLLPQYASDWDAMLTNVGLDPNDTNTSLDNPAGIGNAAGNAIVAEREHDGMNQLGDEGGCRYNCRPYADYTGFVPVNTPELFWNPRFWQPDIVSSGNGIFVSQQFVTPFMEDVTPFGFDNSSLQAPIPWRSYAVSLLGRPLAAYKAQAAEVLAASANLNDDRKMKAELFNDKIRGLGFSIVFLAQDRGMSLQEFVELDFLTNLAAFDTAIVVWKEKRRYNTVRPFSAIRYTYDNSKVTAWGGPGRGTVSDIKGKEWRSYLQTADHPEYPSGSSALCHAHATAATLYMGTNELGWAVPAPAGSSVIEPGITPATDLTLGPWATWDEFAEECGLSRLWAGVHFMDAITAGAAIGEVVGTDAYDFLLPYINGTAR